MLKSKGFNSLFLSIAFVMLFTACTQNGGTNKPSEAVTTTNKSTSASGKQIQITFWAGTGFKNIEGTNTPNYGDWEKMKAEQFQKLHPNVKIDVVSIPFSDIEQKVNVAVAGNNPPDILFDNVPMRIMRHAKNNQYEDLDGIISRERADWKTDQLKSGLYNGKVYALPLYIQPSIFIINKTLFKNKGLENLIPQNREWTWTEFENALKKVSDKNVYGTAFFAKNNQNDQVNAAWLVSAGAKWANNDYSNYTINSPEGVEALNFMLRLMDQGLVAPGPASMQASDSIELFKQGKVAVIFNVPEVYGQIAGTNVEPYGISPAFKEGITPKMFTNGENGYALFKQNDPEKRELAMEFIKSLTTAQDVKAISKAVFGVPVRKSSEYTIDNPDFEQVLKKVEKLEVVDLGKTVPWYADLRQKFYPQLQAAFLKQKTPKQALDDFVKDANELAKQK